TVGREIGLNLMPYMQSAMDWTMKNMPKIKDTVSGAFETVGNSIRNVIDWFRELSPQTKKLIGVTTGMALALGPVSMGIGAVLKVFGPLIGMAGKGFTVIGKFGGLLPILKTGFVALTG